MNHTMKALLLPVLLSLASCANGPRTLADGWHAVSWPGKASTSYTWTTKDGREAVAARSERSASMWRRHLAVPREQLGDVSFSWWVPAVLSEASVADADREDASARVVFAFGGDHASLSLRNRMMFDLAEALTGEMPPYATLMYVWDAKAAVGSVVVNPRSDRIRKIVLDSGSTRLAEWRDHRRDLVADFRRAFGEDPGPLKAVAVMTDTDNTRSSAEAWYGPIQLH